MLQRNIAKSQPMQRARQQTLVKITEQAAKTTFHYDLCCGAKAARREILAAPVILTRFRAHAAAIHTIVAAHFKAP
ncbi:MAG: hypothetical protein K8S25_08385 [Alphaproteobacteria bacterium]|nr:hypothetical protein [Alphaproteobacteria bacterium]